MSGFTMLLRFVPLAVLSLFLFSACGGGDGPAAGPALASPGGSQLILTGRAADAPLANASIVANLGSQRFTTSADAAGNYRLPVSIPMGNTDMLSVTAHGVGGQAHIKLIKLIGDAQHARARASSNGDLSAHITPLSTAWYAALLANNGGAAPATQAALDSAAVRAMPRAVFQTAAVLRLAASGGDARPRLALPAGITDTLALATNAAQLEARRRTALSADDSLVEATELALASDPAMVDPAAAAAAGTVRSYFTSDGCCRTPAIDLTLASDGRATVHDWNGATPATWTSNGHAIDVSFNTPREVRNAGQALPVPGPAPEPTVTVTTGLQLRHLAGGDAAGLAFIAPVGYTRYLNGNRPDAPLTGGLRSSWRDWAQLRAPAAASLAGATLFGVPDLRAGAGNDGQLSIRFAADGSARAAEMGDTLLSWKLQDGQLALGMGGGIDLVLVPAGPEQGGVQRWLVRVYQGGQYRLMETWMSLHQGTRAFSHDSAVARWRALNLHGAESFGRHYFNLLASHEGRAEYGTLAGQVTPLWPASWLIDNGKLVIRTYQLPDKSIRASCPSGTSCTLLRQLVWTLISDNGTEVTVIEQYSGAEGGSSAHLSRYSRVGP